MGINVDFEGAQFVIGRYSRFYFGSYQGIVNIIADALNRFRLPSFQPISQSRFRLLMLMPEQGKMLNNS
jgi:hypothetical protein